MGYSTCEFFTIIHHFDINTSVDSFQSISFIKRSCTLLIQPGEFNLLMTTFNLFQMLMDDAIEENSDDYLKFLFNWYQAAIIMSVVWGLGGLLDINSRESFDAFYRQVSFSHYKGSNFYTSKCFKDLVIELSRLSTTSKL